MPYSTVRATAVATVHAALRRFPCLGPAVLPAYLGAIAGCPPPPAAAGALGARDAAGAAAADAAVAEFYGRALRDASTREAPAGKDGGNGGKAGGGGKDGAGAAGKDGAPGGKDTGGGSAAAQESVNDGRVAGACTALSGSIELMRHLYRDPPAWRALLRAALASRCHGSSACEDALSGLLMQVAARFKVPPPLGDGAADAATSELLSDLRALGQPGGPLRSSLRYCVATNVVVLLATPLAEGPESAAAARHWAGLLVCDMLLLRHIGALGLSLQVGRARAGLRGCSRGGACPGLRVPTLPN
jgi:hypothetical protein